MIVALLSVGVALFLEMVTATGAQIVSLLGRSPM